MKTYDYPTRLIDVITPSFIITALFTLLLALYPFIVWLFHATAEFNKRGDLVAKIPPRYPIIGHLYDLLPDTMLHTLLWKPRKYGSNFNLYLFNKRHKVIGDMETIKEMLTKRPKIFRRPRSFQLPFKLLGMPDNLFIAEGAVWSRIRRLTSPQFSKQNVVKMFSVVADEVSVLLTRLEACADGSTVTAMDYAVSSFTNRVIGRVAVGVDVDAAAGVQESGESSTSYFTSELMTSDVRLFLEFTLQCVMFPLPHWAWRFHSGLKSLDQETLEASKRFDSACARHVDAVRTRLKAQNTGGVTAEVSSRESGVGVGDSLIEALLRESERMKRVDPTSAEITDSEVLAGVKAMFIAGSDTTSVTITWAMYLLSQSSQWREIIRDEVSRVCVSGSGSVRDGPSTIEEANRLVLTSAFIKETIRLYSPAPFLGLELVSETESYTCESSGMVVEPSDQVIINIDGLSTDPDIFSEPDAFDPMRWVSNITPNPKGNGSSFAGTDAGTDAGTGVASTGIKVMGSDSLGRMEQAFMCFGGGKRWKLWCVVYVL